MTTRRTKRKSRRASKPSGQGWPARLVQHVWPQERDFFERPDRYKYVRRLLPESDECVFCAALKNGVNSGSLVLAKDAHAMVVMNKYPYNTGHLLVLPAEHRAELSDLSDEVAAGIMKWLRFCAVVLRRELNCQGFNMGLNLGAVAGAGIPGHLHWHVVPRWGGDTNFFPLIAETKVIPETLEQTYERLKPHFKNKGRDEADV